MSVWSSLSTKKYFGGPLQPLTKIKSFYKRGVSGVPYSCNPQGFTGIKPNQNDVILIGHYKPEDYMEMGDMLEPKVDGAPFIIEVVST